MSVRKIASTVAAISNEMASGHSSVHNQTSRSPRRRKLSAVPDPEPDLDFGPPPRRKEEESEEPHHPEIEDQNELLNLRGLLSEKSGSLKRTRGNRTYLTSKSEGKKSSRVKKGCMVDKKID